MNLSTVTRWCCSVHKTAPQILKLRELLQKPDFTGMGFVGVRADESLARSKYDYVSYGEKHKGQYSCNAILNWSSAEIFLYIYQQNLIMNETYKKGNRRAGCLICPRAAERNDFMNHYCYREEAEPYSEKRLKDNSIEINVEFPTTNWKEWIKTIGILGNDFSPYTIMFRGKILQFELYEHNNKLQITIDGITARENSEFVKLIKNVFRKVSSCM